MDEDSITMAVEAAMGCFRFISREDIHALYFATTTGPYAEKAQSTLVSVACDLSDDTFTSDFTASTRAGTNALKSALDGAVANEGQNSGRYEKRLSQVRSGKWLWRRRCSCGSRYRR